MKKKVAIGIDKSKKTFFLFNPSTTLIAGKVIKEFNVFKVNIPATIKDKIVTSAHEVVNIYCEGMVEVPPPLTLQ